MKMPRLFFLIVLSFIFTNINANESHPEKETKNPKYESEIGLPCVMTVIAIANDNELCEGASTTIDAIPDDGLDPITFIWAPGGQTTSSISVTPLTTTTYAVTATDDQGCTAEHEVTVVVHPQPDISLSATAQTICDGNSTTINATANNGTQPYTFFWDNGLGTGPSQVVSPNSNTTYTVTVVDVENCEDSESITISVNPSPTATATSDPTSICSGSTSNISATATSGTPAYSFSWDQSVGAGQNHSVSPTSTTTYTVTVTDSNNCTDEASTEVQVLNSPSPLINGNDSFCDGGSTTLDAGPGFSTYIWSTGSTLQTISVSSSGIYSVTVTNSDNCSGTDDFEVTVHALPSVLASATPDVLCQGEESTLIANGSGGSSPYDYNWDQGLGSGAIQDVSPDMTTTYTVTVTDANLCESTASVIIMVNPNPNLSVSADPQIICEGDESELEANGTGGTSPYIYEWDQGLGSGGNHTVSPIITTTYSVTIFDINGCTNQSSQTISVNSSPNPSISGNTILCEGDVTELTASDGFLSYFWSTNENTPSIFVETEGLYSVTVTDFNGCQGSATVEVFVNDGLEPQISGDSEICEGQNSSIDAGAGFSSYLWNTGSSDQVITVSDAGTYTVSVTNDTGCEGEASFELTVFPNPQGSAGDNGPLCEGEDIELNAGGGSTYMWSGPIGFSSNDQNPTIQNGVIANSGVYSVTITDNNGCTDVEVTDVVVNQLPTGSISSSGSICEGEPLMLFADGGGSYDWSGPNSFVSNVQNPVVDPSSTLNSGLYTVQITNNFDCSVELSTEVEIFENPDPVISGNTTICQGASASLQVIGTYISYLWSNGLVDKNIIVDEAGTYSVTVTDSNGCIGSTQVTVTSEDALNPQIVGDTVICNESPVLLDAGGGFDDYQWSSGDTSQTIVANTAGSYIVNVATDNGCMGSDTITIIGSTIFIESSINNEICLDACDASINITSDPNYTYSWSNGSSGSLITDLCADVYDLTITDQFQCVLVQSYTVSPGYSYEVEINLDNNNNNATANPTGGLGPYSYLWSSGETTETIMLSGSKVFDVTVTDANGCIAVQSIHWTSNENIETSLKPVISPNPVQNELFIYYQAEESDVQSITIINLQGKIVKSETGSKRMISVKDLESGLYIIRFHAKETIYSTQFILAE